MAAPSGWRFGETMKEAAVPPGYRCPLCPGHDDERFFPSPLFDGPICDGCSIELSSFAEAEERPDDFLIDRVEQATGRPWSECRNAILRSELDYWAQLRDQELEDWMVEIEQICGQNREELLSWLAHRIRDLRDKLGLLPN
jgi:hypothetical protein